MPTTMDRSHRRFLLFLVILMSVLFLWMVRSFLITILLAAIFYCDGNAAASLCAKTSRR